MDNKHKESQMYWATGLASTASNIFTPFVVFLSLRKTNKPLITQYNLLINEIGRHFISGNVGLLSYFGGGALVKGVINLIDKSRSPDKKTDEGNKHLYMLIGGIATKFICSTFIKPLLNTKVICLFLEKEDRSISFPQEQMRKLLSQSHSVLEASKKLESAIQEKPTQDKAALETSPLVQKIKQGIKKHFFDSNEQPKLLKFVTVTATLKTAWLGALAATIYGISRLAGSKKPASFQSTNNPSYAPIKPTPSLNSTNPVQIRFAATTSYKMPL